ncbi:hypothetical protein ONZ43_g1554 [Nemania bipapillata]|uniref:Uncharacterized protein n=1 Tax=Nemania bipapillata TaxID=110536 RepID=A0ACC2J465_9PEZI|nr:hypothetical protein ONZ43_g1554 [Nemania bipapillata]
MSLLEIRESLHVNGGHMLYNVGLSLSYGKDSLDAVGSVNPGSGAFRVLGFPDIFHVVLEPPERGQMPVFVHLPDPLPRQVP